MRIGIDARKILNPHKGESIGVGHYTYQLIRYLLEIDHENEYVIFFDASVRQKDVRKFTQKNVKIVFYPFSDYKKYLPGVYNEILASAILSRENLDILHVTSTEVQIPATYRGRVVLTVHDLGVLKTPESYKKVVRLQAKTMKRFIIKKADHIIAVSRTIADDVINIYNIAPEMIDVIHSGLDKRFFIVLSETLKRVAIFFMLQSLAFSLPVTIFLYVLLPIWVSKSLYFIHLTFLSCSILLIFINILCF